MTLRQRLFSIFVLVVPLWYALTQLLSRGKRSRPVPTSSPRGFAERIRWGRQWQADPLGGGWDTLTHPGRTQRVLDESPGDCDDHAAYRIACMHHVMDRPALAIIRYRKHGARRLSGHVVAIWEDDRGRRWWADYGLPQEYTVDAGFAQQYVGDRGTLVNAAVLPVRGVTSSGRLRFGRARVV